MSKPKIQYCLSINNADHLGKLNFSYGQTHNINLYINSKGASIYFCTEKNYLKGFENSYIYNLSKEGIKRIALLYILQYQKPLNISNITLTAFNGENKLDSLDVTNLLFLYQMFCEKLIRPINNEWKNSLIQQQILNYKKSGNELSRAVSSLYAYLFSKTKKLETERFSYLWIAMNGFFAAATNINKDRQAMNAFVEKYGIGKTVLTGKEREKVCSKAIYELMKIPEPVTKENLEDDAHKPFSDFIQEKIAEYDNNDFDVTPYGFLLTDFPYYLRCKLFHAERPIELFSFESDWELKSLRIVNGLLENFLDQNLHLLFMKTI